MFKYYYYQRLYATHEFYTVHYLSISRNLNTWYECWWDASSKTIIWGKCLLQLRVSLIHWVSSVVSIFYFDLRPETEVSALKIKIWYVVQLIRDGRDVRVLLIKGHVSDPSRPLINVSHRRFQNIPYLICLRWMRKPISYKWVLTTEQFSGSTFTMWAAFGLFYFSFYISTRVRFKRDFTVTLTSNLIYLRRVHVWVSPSY